MRCLSALVKPLMKLLAELVHLNCIKQDPISARNVDVQVFSVEILYIHPIGQVYALHVPCTIHSPADVASGFHRNTAYARKVRTRPQRKNTQKISFAPKLSPLALLQVNAHNPSQIVTSNRKRFSVVPSPCRVRRVLEGAPDTSRYSLR